MVYGETTSHMTAKVGAKQILALPLRKSHKWMTAKKPAGEKTPVFPTHEV